ncbi:hypothetical protein LO762_11380 [Actinocorallia sp. API 0066]|uniref:hypothetical protein n=1 Tax=Actinocorallia sp. API 0066 TaxID=2896846 RepID=UPI001E435253|nr:hypothetical protein [Actinocorallia sp. API 0066]MCD0449786.1 hypothetical protein [Actinocorallia sp. API 0066]
MSGIHSTTPYRPAGDTGAPVAPSGAGWWQAPPGGRAAEPPSIRDAFDALERHAPRRPAAAPKPTSSSASTAQILTAACGQCGGRKGAWIGSSWHRCNVCDGKGVVIQ